MRTLRNLIIAAIVLVGGAVWAADASPDIEQWVPADCQIAVRVELARMLEAPQLAALQERILTPDRQIWLDTVAEITGIDLRIDVERALLAGYLGDDRKKDGVVFLQGTWNQNRVREFCSNMDSYEKAEHAGQTLHGFWSNDDGEMRYVLFPSDDTLAIGRLEPMKRCAEAAGDPAKRLVENTTYVACRKRIDPKAVVAIAAVVPPAEPRKEIERVLVKNLRGIYAGISLADKVDVAVGFLTPDDETAQAGKEIVEGFVNLARLIDGRPVLQDFASRVHATTADAAVECSMSARTDEAENLIQLVRRGGRM